MKTGISMKSGFLIAVRVIVVINFFTIPAVEAASFLGLGDLPGGAYYSMAVGVSADEKLW